MRATLWLVALFGVAVAVALFAGNNQSTVTVFWPPYRVDLSLNMVPVSYTHLDVYKRQVTGRDCGYFSANHGGGDAVAVARRTPIPPA